MSDELESGLLAIERELREENVSALRRVAERLEGLLAELQELERRFREPLGPVERTVVVRRHGEVRAAAERQRWYLVVQREAMGFRNQCIVDELYPIPRQLPGGP